MFQHWPGADGEGLKSFEKKVAEVGIKSFPDVAELVVGFSRKGITQVLQHQAFPVTYNIVE